MIRVATQRTADMSSLTPLANFDGKLAVLHGDRNVVNRAHIQLGTTSLELQQCPQLCVHIVHRHSGHTMCDPQPTHAQDEVFAEFGLVVVHRPDLQRCVCGLLAGRQGCDQRCPQHPQLRLSLWTCGVFCWPLWPKSHSLWKIGSCIVAWEPLLGHHFCHVLCRRSCLLFPDSWLLWTLHALVRVAMLQRSTLNG